LKELEDEHTFSDDTIEVLRAFVMQQWINEGMKE
jgi:uncharacterized coiled-coil protein SlyX